MKNRIASTIVVLSLLGDVAAVASPPSIGPAQVRAAATAVAAESGPTNFARAESSDVQSIKKSNTAIVVLLCVIVVGAGVYLIANNANRHGGNGLFRERPDQGATRTVPVGRGGGLLCQRWVAR